jgi:hypothetical protein
MLLGSLTTGKAHHWECCLAHSPLGMLLGSPLGMLLGSLTTGNAGVRSQEKEEEDEEEVHLNK